MPSPTPLTKLVQVAANQESLTGITSLLCAVTKILNAWGTLMWVLPDSADLDKGQGRLFVLAYWVADPKIRVWHEIGLDSMAGWVLRHRKADQGVPDDPRTFKPTPKLISESGTKRLALAPLQLSHSRSDAQADEKPTRAVLEVYRQQDEPFSEEEMLLLTEIASVLPVLYANLTDRVGVKLLNNVDKICFKVGADLPSYEKTWDLIVREVAATFSSLEAAIFVRSIDDEAGLFPLVAHHKVWEGPWTGRTVYQPGQGATGYVLQTGRTVQLNLSHYADDRDWIQKTYPGLEWEGSLRIKDRAQEYFGAHDAQSAPPVDFLCAPIKAGNDILGVIRCSASTASPFYFDEWQAQSMEALGLRLGPWWENIQKQRQLNRELNTWQLLMEGFDQMNRFVQRHLNRQNWDESAFFREAMRLAHRVIPGTDNSDVVLIDGNELATIATYGPDWDAHPRARAVRYRIDPPESPASHLLSSQRRVDVFDNLADAPRQQSVFTGTRKLILAKIEAGEKVYGVLRIRSKSHQPFSPNVRLIAALLGQQLGLYHSLAQQIQRLQAAQKENREVIETQGKILGDVHHQVKTPIINAHRTAQKMIRNSLLPGGLRPEAERVRGLCGKVSRVVRNMGMFADLSASKPVRLKRTLLTRDVLLRMLRDARDDHQALVDEGRNLTFQLVEKSFDELAGADRMGKLVEADWALIEQCINNLIDNAAKYSYDDTIVVLSGGVQSRGTQFFISVVNDGFEIQPEDVSKLKERGFRSDRAISVTGEGSGIGLWIVDEIMKAHGGRLEITPTHNQRTEFRLSFPVVKGVDKLTYESQSAYSRR